MCLSLSVTSQYFTEMAKCRITQTMPHHNLGLKFSDAENLGKTQMGSPQTEMPNAGGVG